MSQINAYRVRNLRSLEDTGFIPMKPITILVGRNSAGKSTLARLLPLLRQTAEVRKRAPILWWGRLVDFGSFSDSVNRWAEPKEIEISLKVAIDGIERSAVLVHGATGIQWKEKDSPLAAQEVEATLTLLENPASRETILSRIELKKGDDVYQIRFSRSGDAVDSIRVNSFTWNPDSALKQEVSFSSLMPSLQFRQERTVQGPNGEIVGLFVREPLREALISHFFSAQLVHGNTSADSVADICRQLLAEDKDRLLSLLKSGVGLQSLAYSAATMTVRDHRFLGLRDRLLASHLNSLLSAVDEGIVGTVGRCAYIEPLRATAERYYRKQELAVDEVDSKGANVPFFLESLTANERERFESWMLEHLRAGVRTSSEGGHLSIKLRDSSGVEANLADVGFGFSQLLPVALQLWAASKRGTRLRGKRQLAPATVVIEQPELHLHPEYQAKIADLLRSTVEGRRVRVIVETHSPSLVNRLGLLIASKDLDREDVQILRFDKDDGARHTTVARSEFDEQGVLSNWPYGFFDA